MSNRSFFMKVGVYVSPFLFVLGWFYLVNPYRIGRFVHGLYDNPILGLNREMVCYETHQGHLAENSLPRSGRIIYQPRFAHRGSQFFQHHELESSVPCIPFPSIGFRTFDLAISLGLFARVSDS